jgi:hypothetical protein
MNRYRRAKGQPKKTKVLRVLLANALHLMQTYSHFLLL